MRSSAAWGGDGIDERQDWKFRKLKTNHCRRRVESLKFMPVIAPWGGEFSFCPNTISARHLLQ
jgi:hypothetical protein